MDGPDMICGGREGRGAEYILSLMSCLPRLEGGIIAAYGSGGKSSLLNRLGREISTSGGQVISTTTTRIYRPEGGTTVLGNTPGELESAAGKELRAGKVVTVGSSFLPGGKLEGIKPYLISHLRKCFPAAWILVEADGAAGLPLKGHDWYEPVLPPDADLILPVVGLSAWGSPAGPETVHRPHILLPALGSAPNETLTEEHLAGAMRLLVCRGQEQAPGARIVPVFNQADRVENRAVFTLITGHLAGWDCPKIEKVLFTALRENNPVRFISTFDSGTFITPVCCVVLAAGISERMGCDKLGLLFRGKTILEHTVDRVASCGFIKIVVVVRPGSWIRRTVFNPGVSVVVNPRYREGIATSLQAGLAAVAGNQAVLFALADQPQVASATYRALLDSYCSRLTFITYPLWKGRRGNPVLFDRCTWPRLLELSGDTGGRKILPFYKPEEITALEVDDPAVCKDLDRPEDYRKLVEQEKP